MFSVESECFAEGGFRKAYKCESIDGKLPGKWVLKKYKENALEDMKSQPIRRRACKEAGTDAYIGPKHC